MSCLLHTRIANNTLVALSLSLAVGIFVFQYFDRPRLTIVFGVAAGVLFSTAAALVPRGVSPIAFLLVAFVGTGYLLALVEARSVSPNRIVRMFERGELLSDEPVEVSGIIQGQPEAAPDGFYLTLR